MELRVRKIVVKTILELVAVAVAVWLSPLEFNLFQPRIPSRWGPVVMRRIIRPTPLIGATTVGSRASAVSSHWAAAGVAAGPQYFPETVQMVRRVAVVVAMGPIQGDQR